MLSFPILFSIPKINYILDNMGFYGYVALVLYIAGFVFLSLRYLLRKSKLRRFEDTTTILSVILFVYFFIALYFAMTTSDPIFDSPILLEALGATGVTLLTYGALKAIKSEVKVAIQEVSGEPITYRTIPTKQAREEILEYLEHRKGKVWMENVIDDLQIEPSIVIKVIKQLHKEGKLK